MNAILNFVQIQDVRFMGFFSGDYLHHKGYLVQISACY